MSTRALKPSRTFPTHLIVGSLAITLLILSLFAISLTPTNTLETQPDVASSQANLTMSGALFANPATEDITLSCNGTETQMTLGFNGGFSTLVTVTTPRPDGVHSFGNTTSTLELSLLNAAGKPYQTFRASEGSLELQPNSGRFSAVLWNENSEQLFLSGRWIC